MDYTKTHNAFPLITKDKSSVSDLAKEKKEPVKLCKKLLSKMVDLQKMETLMELKNELIFVKN